jgi:hypothetical protein
VRRAALALLGVAGVALALRLLLPPFGPGDIKNTLLAAYDGWLGGAGGDAVGRYGRAPEGLLAWAFLVLPRDDRTVAGLFLVFAVLSAPLLSALARRLSLSRAVGLTAALLWAVAPLAVRFGPTTSRYAPLVFLALAGWTLLLAWLDERRPADLVASVLALTLASQCRPEALFLPAVTLALVVARGLAPAPGVAAAAGWRGRWLLFAAGAAHLLLLAIPAAPLLAAAAAGGPDVAAYLPGRRPLWDPDHNPFLSPAFTPVAWPVLAAIGLVGGLVRGPRRATAWLGLGALSLAALLAGAPVRDGQLLNARYHLTALPLHLLLVAQGLEFVLGALSRRRAIARPALALAALALAATAALPMTRVTRDTAANAEYRFLRAHLAAVPDDCQVVYWYPDADHGLRPQPGLSRSAGRRHRWLHADDWPAAAAGGADCAVFWRSAACAAAGDERLAVERRACAGLLAQQMGAIAEASVPAVPIRAERYEGDPLPVGLYWLRRP